MKSDILVAKLGKSIGLKGDIRLFIESDFPEIFKPNTTFFTHKNQLLTISSINKNRSSVKFLQINSVDEAKKYTNSLLYMSLEDTKKYCSLDKDEYFWFDLIGLNVYENDTLLGTVKDIQRLPLYDYLEITTNINLDINQKLPKIFLIPYQDNFIQEIDLKNRQIKVKNSLDILLTS